MGRRESGGVVCVAVFAAEQRHTVTQGLTMGASKRPQMKTFDDDWPDQVWSAIEARNNGRGASCALAVATLAVTGCRPSALEKGVTFSIVKRDGKNCIEAVIQGVKLTENRGQPSHIFRWSSQSDTHRERELVALTEAIARSPGRTLTIRYDAEGISTKLRELSQIIWPRRKNKITGYCYRELLSATAKAAGAPPEEIALALGHRSAESQGSYARAGRIKRGGTKPWGMVAGSVPVKMERAPMARFKAASALKKAKLRRAI